MSRPSAVFVPGLRRSTVAIVAGVAFIAFEAMAVATAMPDAVAAVDGLPLYGLAFSAFYTTSLFGMVLAGEIADQRGPRVPVLLGAATFTVGLLLAGTATSMWPFVLGRATQGLGGGVVIVALYVVVARAYTPAQRPRVFGAMSAAWVVPSIVGPLLAGALAEHLSWRWVFLGLAPLVVLPVVMMRPMLARIDGPPPGGANRRRGRVWLALGAAVGMGVLQYAGTDPGWLTLAFALVALVVLVRCVPRLLPPGTPRLRPGLPTVVAMRGILAGAFIGAEAFIPLMLVTHRGLTLTQAGLTLTGGAVGWATGSWFQGRDATTVPRHRLIRTGAVAVFVGIVGMSLVLVPGVPVVVGMLTWTIGGAGMGMAMSSVSVLLFTLSPPADQGANSAALQMSDALLTVMTIGLGGVVVGQAHGVAAATEGPGRGAFLTIFVLTGILVMVGAAAAGRVRPRGAHGDAGAGGTVSSTV